MFLREVTRLPGGQLRQLSKDLEMHIDEWTSLPSDLRDNIERIRLETKWRYFTTGTFYNVQVPAGRVGGTV